MRRALLIFGIIFIAVIVFVALLGSTSQPLGRAGHPLIEVDVAPIDEQTYQRSLELARACLAETLGLEGEIILDRAVYFTRLHLGDESWIGGGTSRDPAPSRDALLCYEHLATAEAGVALTRAERDRAEITKLEGRVYECLPRGGVDLPDLDSASAEELAIAAEAADYTEMLDCWDKVLAN